MRMWLRRAKSTKHKTWAEIQATTTGWTKTWGPGRCSCGGTLPEKTHDHKPQRCKP